MCVTISSTLLEKKQSMSGMMRKSFDSGVARRGMAGRPVKDRPVGGSQGLVPSSEIYVGGPLATLSKQSAGTLIFCSSLGGKPRHMFKENETMRMDKERTYKL